MAMIPRIFRVNLESMAMNPGIFSMENLESMVMNPGWKIGLIREDIGRAKQESMAMIPRIFRVNLESMAMNPGGKIGLIREDIGRAKQESMAMTRRIFRANLESMAMNPGIIRASLESMAMKWDGLTTANNGHQRRPLLLS